MMMLLTEEEYNAVTFNLYIYEEDEVNIRMITWDFSYMGIPAAT
jgi:hypothetical protein